jgi:hypothetical protein
MGKNKKNMIINIVLQSLKFNTIERISSLITTD